jgi:hypothetical protein
MPMKRRRSHRADRASAGKRVEHQIVRSRGGKHDARQERLGFLRRMQLFAVAALEPLLAGAERNEPVVCMKKDTSHDRADVRCCWPAASL